MAIPDNRVCLITGSARGIGAGIAERFARGGYTVVISDLRIQDAEATANKIADTFKAKTLALVMNVADEDEVNATLPQLRVSLGTSM